MLLKYQNEDYVVARQLGVTFYYTPYMFWIPAMFGLAVLGRFSLEMGINCAVIGACCEYMADCAACPSFRVSLFFFIWMFRRSS